MGQVKNDFLQKAVLALLVPAIVGLTMTVWKVSTAVEVSKVVVSAMKERQGETVEALKELRDETVKIRQIVDALLDRSDRTLEGRMKMASRDEEAGK